MASDTVQIRLPRAVAEILRVRYQQWRLATNSCDEWHDWQSYLHLVGARILSLSDGDLWDETLGADILRRNGPAGIPVLLELEEQVRAMRGGG